MSRQAAAARIRQKLAERVRVRAEQAERIAAQLHMNAPRGGTNLNMFGQPRSAPGEQPAVETGALLGRILNETVISGLRAQVTVNYKVLEYGYYVGARSRISDRAELTPSRMAPRPMGRMTVARLKAEDPARPPS